MIYTHLHLYILDLYFISNHRQLNKWKEIKEGVKQQHPPLAMIGDKLESLTTEYASQVKCLVWRYVASFYRLQAKAHVVFMIDHFMWSG